MSNLQLRLAKIDRLIGDTENVKLGVAREVRAIHKGREYEEDGFKSFAAFLPLLLERTAHVGWNADRTVKAYIKYVAVYEEQLNFGEDRLISAVSHLMELLKLPATGKDFALQPDTDKPGFLTDEDFGEVAEAVSWVVVPREKGDAKRGYEVINRLLGTDYTEARTWTLADTKNLVAKIQNKPETVKSVVTRTWYANHNGPNVEITGLAIDVDGETVLAPPMQQALKESAFEKMVGKDTVVWDEGDALEDEDDGE